VVADLRARPSSVQACLNANDARRFREDQSYVKEVIQQWAQQQSNTRPPSVSSFNTAVSKSPSIASYYTELSIPFADGEEWHEIERELRQHGLTPQIVSPAL